MEITKSSRRKLRFQTLIFILLFLAVIGLLAAVSVAYKAEFDWTATSRHTLSEASIKVLERLPDPITITSYASGSDLTPVRLRVKDLIKRYQKHKQNISLQFIDPFTNPDKVRELGIRSDGEMIIQYQNRTQHVQSFDETSLTNALQRLLRVAERELVFITGHGERDPLGRANHDLGSFFNALSNKGLRISKINLAQERSIPSNATAVVIASPQVDYLDGEIKLIKDYLDQGGSLLWLHDPLGKANLSGLANHIGVKVHPGIIIDLEIRQLGINDPTIVMAPQYPAHAITQHFSLLTLFPGVTALEALPDSSWQHTPFLQSIGNSWLETGKLQAAIKFDRGVDLEGPLTFGLAGTRHHNVAAENATGQPTTQLQRVVILGDGDFLSNAILGNQGNQQLGENIINWLGHDDNFIDIPVSTAPGNKLSLSATNWALLAAFFLFAMPGLLIGSGIYIWVRRRKR